ncbi:hypothetical protein RF11_13294 [Thelohanellus kitauei]|uniref:Uncharacterized protein n=1 Tax=Thelohanellus kitauei TaxID=669202 RepID=A0A0C2JUR9_THEKT|nr:hypothetical protein RF11_13294 [Thelohanellus kitauei]
MTHSPEDQNEYNHEQSRVSTRFFHIIYIGSFLIIDEDEPLDFLLANYRRSAYFRKLVDEYERTLKNHLEQNREDDLYIYNLTEQLRVKILQKLCKYYGGTWLYCPTHGKFKYSCPPHEINKPTILELAQGILLTQEGQSNTFYLFENSDILNELETVEDISSDDLVAFEYNLGLYNM